MNSGTPGSKAAQFYANRPQSKRYSNSNGRFSVNQNQPLNKRSKVHANQPDRQTYSKSQVGQSYDSGQQILLASSFVQKAPNANMSQQVIQ